MSELPSSVIATLEEHTAGGYILFRIDENNRIQTYMDFDSEIHERALMSKALVFLTSHEKAESKFLVDNIMEGMYGLPGGDFLDEEPEDDIEEDEE